MGVDVVVLFFVFCVCREGAGANEHFASVFSFLGLERFAAVFSFLGAWLDLAWLCLALHCPALPCLALPCFCLCPGLALVLPWPCLASPLPHLFAFASPCSAGIRSGFLNVETRRFSPSRLVHPCYIPLCTAVPFWGQRGPITRVFVPKTGLRF